jgi:5-methylcytosine-specific restriction endonuclease McrA
MALATMCPVHGLHGGRTCPTCHAERDHNRDQRPGRKYHATAAHRKRRRRLLAPQCEHCGATDDLVLDYIIPLSRGGEPTDDNTATLCRACNSRKGNR